MPGVDIPALRANLAAFIKDPRTIQAFEQLGNTAVDAQGVADDATTTAATAQTAADLALSLIDLLADASYLTLSTNATLDNERVLTAGNLIGFADTGSGGNLTVNVNSTTVGGNFVSLTNPSAIAFPRINADNSVTAMDAATALTSLGAQAAQVLGTWTPTITAFSGTITTKSARGRYIQEGNKVTAYIDITITTNGTGAAAVIATLPFAAKAGTMSYTGSGTRNTGSLSNATVNAIVGPGSATAAIELYDGTYPAVNSSQFFVTIDYEI